jgi:hypothetical protein
MHHLEKLCVVYQAILIHVSLINDHLQNINHRENIKLIVTNLNLLLSQRLPHEPHHQPQLPPVNKPITILEIRR